MSVAQGLLVLASFLDTRIPIDLRTAGHQTTIGQDLLRRLSGLSLAQHVIVVHIQLLVLLPLLLRLRLLLLPRHRLLVEVVLAIFESRLLLHIAELAESDIESGIRRQIRLSYA